MEHKTKEIPLTQDKVAIVDAADYEWLMQFKWHAVRDNSTWYAGRNRYLSHGKKVTMRMHRIILDAPQGMQVDHIDGNGLNNTRGNLRLVTHTQNQHNRRTAINNTSGYKGVHFNKKMAKWNAQIRIDGKKTHLGYFDTAEEAAAAYDTAARELRGSFARTNF